MTVKQFTGNKKSGSANQRNVSILADGHSGGSKSLPFAAQAA